ncbi:MAG: UDP-N-acetylmuramoyl-L-alanine--D-glutamate ligase [Elusimicrobiota bacterium]
MNTSILSLAGQKIGILGLAKSGVAAANLAVSLGAEVLVSDVRAQLQCPARSLLHKKVRREFGGHSALLLESDLIIKSPGVHGDIPILVSARKKKIPVIGEIEFASRLIRPRRIIAITGTNGKTTATALMGALCKSAGQHTLVGGNIGTPLASLVKKCTPATTLVLEMSSYQLEDSPTFHPSISAILNITPDHLEHHHTMKSYSAAKARIFARQTPRDFCILNYDDPLCRKLARRCPAQVLFFSRKKLLPRGVRYIDDGKGRNIVVSVGKRFFRLPADLRLPGMHNVENVLACVAMAAAAGLPPTVIERTIASFRGVEHRIEFVRSVAGVRYFNDSKGTNVDAARVALESFDDPVWLILGGQDKGSPYAPLRELIKKKVKGILLIGEASPKIRRELAGCAAFYECRTLSRAIRYARKHAQKKEVVLLSPACASFDQFTDFEDRGRQFKEMVNSL